MHLIRFALLALAGCALLLHPLRAQAPAPWTPDKQFSADQVITAANNPPANNKIYVDNGKIRMDSTVNGTGVVAIILTAEKKMYALVADQKIVMSRPMTDAQVQQAAAGMGSGDATFVLIGPDTLDGTACLEYKMTTSSDRNPTYWWINAATKAPVKVTADGGATTVLWKNYKAGPQDPALFQVPADYHVMQMTPVPATGGAPGGQ
jgi:hypothetical protein